MSLLTRRDVASHASKSLNKYINKKKNVIKFDRKLNWMFFLQKNEQLTELKKFF